MRILAESWKHGKLQTAKVLPSLSKVINKKYEQPLFFAQLPQTISFFYFFANKAVNFITNCPIEIVNTDECKMQINY